METEKKPGANVDSLLTFDTHIAEKATKANKITRQIAISFAHLEKMLFLFMSCLDYTQSTPLQFAPRTGKKVLPYWRMFKVVQK